VGGRRGARVPEAPAVPGEGGEYECRLEGRRGHAPSRESPACRAESVTAVRAPGPGRRRPPEPEPTPSSGQRGVPCSHPYVRSSGIHAPAPGIAEHVLMAPYAYRPPPASGASSAAPRLRLNPALRHGAVLDGGWWPRSGEPAAELPGLIRALDGRRGPVQRIELGATGWRSRPDLLQAAGRPVRLCWSSEMPSDLLVAVGPGDARTRLLVVPPGVSVFTARSALDLAALTSNTAGASEIMDAASLLPPPPRTEPESVWESEGGRLYEGGEHPGSSGRHGGTAVALRQERAGPDRTLVRVSGQVDLMPAPECRAGLLAAVRPGAGRVVVDLSGVTFFGAAGVSMLAAVWNRAGEASVDLRVAAPSAHVGR